MGVEGAVRAGVEGRMDGGAWIAEDRIHRWFVFSLFSVGLHITTLLSFTLIYCPLTLISNPLSHSKPLYSIFF